MTKNKKLREIMDLPMIDRGILYVRGKGPYYEWANGFEDMAVLPGEDEGLALLVSDDFYAGQAEAYVKKNYKVIFEHMLLGQWTDESMWPPKLTYSLFEQWFEWKYCSIVYDGW